MTKKEKTLSEMPAELKPARNHKSRLFIRLFSEPEELLTLYNAVNDSSYTDSSQLTVNTLEDALYLSMKNDVSFLIGSEMNLYEHQATWNPNMPLRGLFYLSGLYRGYIAANRLDIYSRVQLHLPVPRYIVFYNGTDTVAERTELRLSDSFEKNGSSGCLECTATVLNINFGHNQKLMNDCRRLYEYSYLVSRIRCYCMNGLELRAAIDRAIGDCLAEDILKEFLTKHREEATMDLMTELFSVERHEMLIREEGKLQGEMTKLISQTCRKLSRGKTPEMIADELEEDISVIRPICETAQMFAPEYDVEKIYEELVAEKALPSEM